MTAARWLIIPALLLAAACESTVSDEAPPLAPGTYALVSIDGVPLPAAEPCSAFRTEEERFTVGSRRGVDYHARLTLASTGEVRTYNAAGSYRTTFDGRVEMRLTSTPGGVPEGFNTVLERTPEGLTQIVAQPCDGRSVKLYRLQR
jgi:hypothetical protein